MDRSVIPTLIGVVLGAITTSIPKFLDFFFENKKHRQANQKLYFERKLDVLQAYVATCTQLSAANFNNAIAVGQIKDFNFFGDQDAMREMVINNIDIHVKKAMVLVDRLSSLSSAASMFIDLKINYQDTYNLVESIHLDIAKLGEIKSKVDSTIEKYLYEFEPSLEDLGGEEYFESKAAYQNHLQRISDNYNKVKSAMNETIKEVRREFRKYES